MWASYAEAMERFYSETFPTFDYRVRDVGDNGEFGTWATLDLLERGEVVHSETFRCSSEFPPEMTSMYGAGHENDAVAQAISRGVAYVEAEERRAEADRLGVHPLELALAPYGPEWQREQMERYEEVR